MPNENTWKVVSTDIISAWNSFHINCDWWTWPTWAILNNWGILTSDRNQVQDNWIIFLCWQWCASLNWIKLHEYCDCIGWCDWCDIELLFINIFYILKKEELCTPAYSRHLHLIAHQVIFFLFFLWKYRC